jgi:hypothetical protein
MEVIHGSVYVELESIVGLFCGGIRAAAGLTTPATTVAAAGAESLPSKRNYHRGRHKTSSNDSSGQSSSSSSSEVKDNEYASQQQQRQLSSHSPFGPSPSSTSVFTERLAQQSGNVDDRSFKASAGTVAPAKATSAAATQRETLSPDTTTPVCPLTIVEAPYPPSLMVRLGEETHLIDIQSLSIASAASTVGFGEPTLSPSSRLSSFCVNPSAGGVASSSDTGDDMTHATAEYPLPSAPTPRVSGGVDTQRQSNTSVDDSRNFSVGSSHGSLPSMSHNPAALAVWEAVLDVVDDTESEMEDNSSPQTAQLTSISFPRSSHLDSVLSATPNEEPNHGTTAGPHHAGTNYSRSGGGGGGAAGFSSAFVSVLHRSDARACHNGRFLTLPSPPCVSSTYQAVPRRQATLLWLAEHLRNDPRALSAITWVGPRPHAFLDATADSDYARAISAFAAAWYSSVFPEDVDGRSVLSCDGAVLHAAMRSLRPWSRHVTAAVFPLHQRFAFVKTKIEVKSRAAFDLHDAMRSNACKRKGSHRDSDPEVTGAANLWGGEVDPTCLVIRLATPAELKKARKGLCKPSFGVHKTAQALDDFLESIRRSFRGLKTKERTPSAETSLKTGVSDLRRRESQPTPPVSPSCHQPHGQSPRHHKKRPSSLSASSAKEVHTDYCTPAEQGKASAKVESCAVRLHLSRLLSPSILDWMKERHTAVASGEESSAAAADASGLSSNDGSDGGDGSAEQPAVFYKSVYVPLPPPSFEVEGSSCMALMLKVNVIFKPGFDSAEPF